MSERCCAYSACGKVLVKRPKETHAGFKKRETCDKVCTAGVYQSRIDEAPVRYCCICLFRPILFNPGEGVPHWKTRQTCGDEACVNKLRAKRSLASKANQTVIWLPKPTSEDTADFSSHNINVGPALGRAYRPDAARSYTASSLGDFDSEPAA